MENPILILEIQAVTLDTLYSLLLSPLFCTERYFPQRKRNDHRHTIQSIQECIQIYHLLVAQLQNTIASLHHTQTMQVILAIVEAPAVMVVGVTLPLLEQDGWQVTGGMDETDVHETIGVLHGDQAGVTLILMRLIITTTTEAHLQIDQNQAPPRRTRRHPELEQLPVLAELREDKLALYKYSLHK